MFLKTSVISCYVATFSQTSATTSFVQFKINILFLLPLTTWRNSHFWCKIKTPKLLHGQQNSFIILWTNGIIRPIVSLMIYDSQWKTGRSTGSCTNQNFLTWYISSVCISSRTYLHFMYINVCRHVGICVGMHAFASAHRYTYAWVCMITHVFKCMLQHVIIFPLIAIHVILICFNLHLCNFI